MPLDPPPAIQITAMATSEALEARLAETLAEGPGNPAGLFGPDSVLWHVNREAVLFLGAGRALLLQLAHPWVAAAIVGHSRALSDPIGRFHRTFDAVYSMVFGTVEQAQSAARRLHRRHGAITGTLPDHAGPFPAGSSYRANETSALAWVHATLAETALMVHDRVLPPLSPAQREHYWTDSCRLARMFGLQAEDLPADWASFERQCRTLWDSPTAAVTDEARRVADALFHRRNSWLRAPGWYLDLTASLLPERVRHGFGLPYGPLQQRRAERVLAWARRVYPRLPAPLRHVAPYQEAMARIDGRPMPGLSVRTLNRFWIGRSRL